MAHKCCNKTRPFSVFFKHCEHCTLHNTCCMCKIGSTPNALLWCASLALLLHYRPFLNPIFFTMFQVCLPPHQIQIHKLCFWAFGWVGRSGEWLYLRWSVMCMINVVFGANFLWVSEFWNLVKIEQNPVIWLLQRKKIVCQSSRENHVAAENHPKLTR